MLWKREMPEVVSIPDEEINKTEQKAEESKRNVFERLGRIKTRLDALRTAYEHNNELYNRAIGEMQAARSAKSTVISQIAADIKEKSVDEVIDNTNDSLPEINRKIAGLEDRIERLAQFPLHGDEIEGLYREYEQFSAKMEKHGSDLEEGLVQLKESNDEIRNLNNAEAHVERVEAVYQKELADAENTALYLENFKRELDKSFDRNKIRAEKIRAVLESLEDADKVAFLAKLSGDDKTILEKFENGELERERDARYEKEIKATEDPLYIDQQVKKYEEEKRREALYAITEKAESVLGKENILGPEAVEKVFKVRLNAEDVPAIQFTEEDLEVAKREGYYLMLRIAKDAEGNPLTIKQMQRSWEITFESSSTAEAFLEEALNLEWVLSSSRAHKNTSGHSYFDNLLTITKNIATLFPNGEIPEIYREALEEFETYKTTNFPSGNGNVISEEISSNPNKFSVELSNLKIVQLLLKKPVEFLYDAILWNEIHHNVDTDLQSLTSSVVYDQKKVISTRFSSIQKRYVIRAIYVYKADGGGMQIARRV